jgi:hypothetical protein
VTECNHDKYRAYPYMTDEQAMTKLREKNDICWIGEVVTHCECGAYIGKGRRVLVKTVKEYMSEQ